MSIELHRIALLRLLAPHGFIIPPGRSLSERKRRSADPVSWQDLRTFVPSCTLEGLVSSDPQGQASHFHGLAQHSLAGGNLADGKVSWSADVAFRPELPRGTTDSRDQPPTSSQLLLDPLPTHGVRE